MITTVAAILCICIAVIVIAFCSAPKQNTPPVPTAKDNNRDWALRVYYNGCAVPPGKCPVKCPMYKYCHYAHGGFTPREASLMVLGGLGKIEKEHI